MEASPQGRQNTVLSQPELDTPNAAWGTSRSLLGSFGKNRLDVPIAVQNTDYLQRRRFRTLNNQIRIDGKEPYTGGR